MDKKRGFGSKKGLSTIVATLIIILLVFVAVGIIWVVVRNFIQGGSDQLDLTSNCLDVSVTPTRVNVVDAVTGDYNVTVSRDSGDAEIGGISLIFTAENGTSNVVENVPGNLGIFEVRTYEVVDTLPNADNVEVYAYFLDSSGEEQFCTTSSSLSF